MKNKLVFTLITLLALAGLLPAHVSHAQDDSLAGEINDYLVNEGSPLAGLGTLLVNSGQAFDVDPRLVVAIAGAETNYGQNGCGVAPSYNAWNWFPNDGGCEANRFESYAAAAGAVTEGLRALYLDQGYTSISSLASAYPSDTNASTWASQVQQILQTLGGNPNDLTFPAGASVGLPGAQPGSALEGEPMESGPLEGGVPQAVLTPGNLLRNPGFESGGANAHLYWSFTPHNNACSQYIYTGSTPVGPHSGVRKMHFTANSSYPNCRSIYQDVSVNAASGQQYTFGVWLASEYSQYVDVSLWWLN
ncbi:MAG: hypothetical protein GYB65_23040, partial [Chloroflexi bacterium]|nr:hypothetical protein [Chloroflexota bacterium]